MSSTRRGRLSFFLGSTEGSQYGWIDGGRVLDVLGGPLDVDVRVADHVLDVVRGNVHDVVRERLSSEDPQAVGVEGLTETAFFAVVDAVRLEELLQGSRLIQLLRTGSVQGDALLDSPNDRLLRGVQSFCSVRGHWS